jgi:hypothetical protein
MTQIKTIDDLYAEVDKLIAKLKSSGHARLAGVLFQRLHEVAWTSGSELLDELATILKETTQSSSGNLGPDLRQDVEDILRVLPYLSKASVHQAYAPFDAAPARKKKDRDSTRGTRRMTD